MTGDQSETGLPPAAGVVLAECQPLAQRFAAAGFRLYLVGGIVRDFFAGRSTTEPDLDFTTNASPAEIKRLVAPVAEALWAQGERFGTIAAKVDGRLVEITTHRAEAYDPESRKPRVVFADDVLVDLSRRDFTINALAVDLTTFSPRLIDPFSGVTDLRSGLLRTPLEPSESFSDDPLRMLRAARFVARLDLRPDAGVVTAMALMAERLDVVSAERIRDEFDKLLLSPDPRGGLDLLLATGLATRFVPELSEAQVDAVSALPPDPVVRLAAVLQVAGSSGARQRLRSLRHSRRVIERVSSLVAAVERWRDHDGIWSDAETRTLVASTGDDAGMVVELLSQIARQGVGDSLERALHDLGRREDLEDLGPPLDGESVMAELGLAPGPEVGAALRHLHHLRLATGPLDGDAARRLLHDWWNERSGSCDPS